MPGGVACSPGEAEEQATPILYQSRFKSFPSQQDDHFLTVCRYVARNPLRANLVEKSQDSPWGSLGCRAASDN